MLGVSISLDELAIGFTLGLLHLPALLVIALIGAQALILSQLGLRLGARVGAGLRARRGAARWAGPHRSRGRAADPKACSLTDHLAVRAGQDVFVRRFMMIRHGLTPAVRSASFGLDEPLEPAAVLRARELGTSLPSRCAGVSGPERACVETGSELGLSSFVIEELAACDVGIWKGRSLAEVAAEDPEGLAGWMSDPHTCPHGGESLTVFRARVVAALDARAGGEGFLAVVVDGGAVKAAVVHALGARASAFWRVDVAPLSVTEIHVEGGRWTLARVNCQLARSEGVRYRA